MEFREGSLEKMVTLISVFDRASSIITGNSEHIDKSIVKVNRECF